MVSLTVPGSPNGQAQIQSDGLGNFKSVNQAPTTYVFDAVMQVDHEQRVTKTRHPVQTGADISSHAFLEPARVVLYVGMSDAMDSYASGRNPSDPPYITAFSGNPSKSVAAYQQMVTLASACVPLTLVTRLRTYKNMLIVGLSPNETVKTIAGLKMRLELEEILTASVTTVPNSTRPNDTDSTGLGSVNSETPGPQIPNQFNVTSASQQSGALTDAPTANLLSYLRSNPQGVNTPGAGTYSSVNTNNLQQLPSPE